MMEIPVAEISTYSCENSSRPCRVQSLFLDLYYWCVQFCNIYQSFH